MTTLYVFAATFILCMSIACVTVGIIIKQYTRAVDKLTDKLMVKQGHREYRQENLMQEEQPTRKPISFYDDPNIEDEAH